MQKFTRNDLKTGDIVVTRDKAVGLVITQKTRLFIRQAIMMLSIGISMTI